MIVANVGLAGLMHTPQSVLRVVDKLPSGGVVMMLAALPSTLAAHLTGLATHSNSNWERVGFPVHSDGSTSAGVVHDYRHPSVRVPN